MSRSRDDAARADHASGAVLTVVCWKWSRAGYRSTFTGEHVNKLAAMVGRHYAGAHKIMCVTNDPSGIDPRVSVIPDRQDFAGVPSPHGAGNPSCYRRLLLFHPDAARWFGDRFVSIDLDVVATADLAPLWDRDEDFVAYRDPNFPAQYCGSMLLLRAGSRPFVWEGFNPHRSPGIAKAAGFRGSDQAWISYAAPWAPTWGVEAGVYSYRRHVEPAGGVLPGDARLVMFHGGVDPWAPRAQALPWVRANYAA